MSSEKLPPPQEQPGPGENKEGQTNEVKADVTKGLENLKRNRTLFNNMSSGDFARVCELGKILLFEEKKEGGEL